jgi:hypothetical protein
VDWLYTTAARQPLKEERSSLLKKKIFVATGSHGVSKPWFAA